MPVFCLFTLGRHGNFTAGVTSEQADLLCTALALNIRIILESTITQRTGIVHCCQTHYLHTYMLVSTAPAEPQKMVKKSTVSTTCRTIENGKKKLVSTSCRNVENCKNKIVSTSCRNIENGNKNCLNQLQKHRKR